MGFSMLHKLRARAAEESQETILAHYHARKLERTPSRAFAPIVRKGWCKVAALATNPACARAAKRAGADLIYVPAANYRRGEAVIAGQISDTAEQAGYPKQCIPVLPTVSQMFDEEKRNGFDTWKRVKADKPVMVENLGQLLHATEMGAAPEVGPHIPVTNKLDLQAMADLGAQRVWLSPELSLVQIEELGDMAPMPLGLTIMGQTELMVTEHCLLMSQGPCNQKCTECARRKSPHYLKDRKGYEMPVITDCTGRSRLYNAVQMDVAHLMPEIIGAGVSTVLVDTTLMNVKETTERLPALFVLAISPRRTVTRLPRLKVHIGSFVPRCFVVHGQVKTQGHTCAQNARGKHTCSSCPYAAIRRLRENAADFPVLESSPYARKRNHDFT